MTLEIIMSNRFEKDLKQAKKRSYKLDLLDQVVIKLSTRQVLDGKYQDHELGGDYAGFRECHIQPDWFLVYRIDHEGLFLLFSRT